MMYNRNCDKAQGRIDGLTLRTPHYRLWDMSAARPAIECAASFNQVLGEFNYDIAVKFCCIVQL